MRPDPDGWWARIYYGALDRPWGTLRAMIVVAISIVAIAISIAVAVLVIDIAMDPQDWLDRYRVGAD